jgi:cellulose synthase/poly-beta-1,6-N-acetylglucosamine synthase-like glycosyltransferase
MLKTCIAIMAYNEEANIGHLLEALLAQRLSRVSIEEIVVVASGCTDRTEEIVNDFSLRDERLMLLVQPRREGKASAINLLLRHTRQEIIVLESADTIPGPDTIENLVAPFADPTVGMTGGRPVPTNDPDQFMGFAAHLLWNLHHRISLRNPKMGELIAFRRFFRQIPHESAVDEASIEPLIRGQGLTLRYVPEAVVYNRGPETLEDFFKQRERIYSGHLYVRDTLGYRVSTMNGLYILPLFLAQLTRGKRHLLWGPAVAILEITARLKGLLNYAIWKRKPFVWSVSETTKELVKLPNQPPA